MKTRKIEIYVSKNVSRVLERGAPTHRFQGWGASKTTAPPPTPDDRMEQLGSDPRPHEPHSFVGTVESVHSRGAPRRLSSVV